MFKNQIHLIFPDENLSVVLISIARFNFSYKVRSSNSTIFRGKRDLPGDITEDAVCEAVQPSDILWFKCYIY